MMSFLPSTVMHKIASGQWIYNLSMVVYTDPGSKNPIESGADVQLDQKVWVELKTDGLDEQIAVVTDSCWATSEPSPSASLRYDLIIKGWAIQSCSWWPNPCLCCWWTVPVIMTVVLFLSSCPNPADQTVKVEGNGVGSSNHFSYNTFRFSGQSDNIYLHCKVKLCVTQGNTCVPVIQVLYYTFNKYIYEINKCQM